MNKKKLSKEEDVSISLKPKGKRCLDLLNNSPLFRIMFKIEANYLYPSYKPLWKIYARIMDLIWFREYK